MLSSYTKCKIICVLSWALQILARATLWAGGGRGRRGQQQPGARRPRHRRKGRRRSPCAWAGRSVWGRRRLRARQRRKGRPTVPRTGRPRLARNSRSCLLG
eukprot:7051325-Pyramimonas_sp.AAC.1